MHVTNIILGSAAIVGALGVIGGFILWIYNRGGEEQLLKDEMSATRLSLDTLRESIERLAQSFTNHAEKVDSKIDAHELKLENHEVRIMHLEKK